MGKNLHTHSFTSASKQIWRGKFIDFSPLLPATGSIGQPNPKFTLHADSQAKLSKVPSNKSKRISSIEQWTTAFLRAVAVYTISMQHPNLLVWGNCKRFGATTGKLCFYDTQFHILLQSLLLPWERIHTDF